MDIQKIEKAISMLLDGLGYSCDTDHCKDTPARVARMYAKELILSKQQEPKLTLFKNDHQYDEVILSKEIPFYSLCSHHLLPFFGSANVGYIPKDNIIGLSKLPRIIDYYSRRLQHQEQLTMQIAHLIQEKLNPKGVIVILKARHLCMEMRGVSKMGNKVITSTVKGKFRDDHKTRNEIFSLLNEKT